MGKLTATQPIPVALQRIIEEVKRETGPEANRYNRVYHRHNRS